MHYKEAKTIITPQNGINIYRGCTHGCIYCDGRAKCNRITHDFEDVEVKDKADNILEMTLKKKRRKGMIATGNLSDPYLPIEKDIRLFRNCLLKMDRFEYGVVIQTKSDLILRDLDILESINRKTKCVVCVSFTTLDDELAAKLEPNVTRPSARVEILKRMKEARIPTIVVLGPILPYITDTEKNIRDIIEMCEECGVYGIVNEGFGIVLREGSKEYFFEKIREIFPEIYEKYERVYDGEREFVSRHSKNLSELFYDLCGRAGIVSDQEALEQYIRVYKNKTNGEQLSLMDFLQAE